MSTGNQGVALMLLAERRRDLEMAKLAVQQIEAAFTTLRDGGDAPSAAIFEAQLPKARALAQNSPRADGSTRRIDGAREAVDGTLEEYRKAQAGSA